MSIANTCVQNLNHLPAQFSIRVEPQPGSRDISQAHIMWLLDHNVENREWELHELATRIRAASLELQHTCECEVELRRLNSARHMHDVVVRTENLHATFKKQARLSSRSPSQNARKQRQLKRRTG